LRNDLANSENAISRTERRIEELRNNPGFKKDLFEVAKRWYDSPPYLRNREDVEILERYEYTSDKYFDHKKVIADNEKMIMDLEKSISEERVKIKDKSETLTAFEEIASMTYVQKLAQAERERQQAKIIGNGIKSADSSAEEKIRVGAIAEVVAEVIEKKIGEEPPVPIFTSSKRK